MCWNTPVPGSEEGQESSAVLKAVLHDSKSSLKGNAVLISSCLPSPMELRAMYDAGIKEVHFIGELDDPDSVAWLNRLSKASPEDGFRVVQLQA